MGAGIERKFEATFSSLGVWKKMMSAPSIDADEDVLIDAFNRACQPLSSIQFAQSVLVTAHIEQGLITQ
jgi:hypothetical protein